MYNRKKNNVVVMGQGVEAFCSHVIKSQSFSVPVPLSYELHMCFSVPLHSPFSWDRMARAGWNWVFPFFQVSLTDNTPAG